MVHGPMGTSVSYDGKPRSAFVLSLVPSYLVWRTSIDDVGRHEFSQTADGARGPVTTTVRVDVLAPPRSDLVLAMGDSIASGHGLERRDYFGFDACWRDSDGAYAAQVTSSLEADGIDRQLAVVACSGARVADLSTDRVTGGPRGMGGARTQLEWAVDSNPGLITLTIGANDLRFDRPDEFFVRGVFQAEVARARIDAMEADLAVLLKRLVMGTDARVVLTTLHNPTSTDPHGVAGCRGECFADVVDSVVVDFNQAVRRVAARHPTRVVVADASDAFVGHGAPNGRGPDWLRAGGGWLTSRLPIPTRGVHPFCQRGHEAGDTWINAADCVHPNGEGHEAYAAAVLEALGR